MTIPAPDDPRTTVFGRVQGIIDAELIQATDAFNRAYDRQALMILAHQAVEVHERHPETESITLTDWSEEVEEGEPFDIALGIAVDDDGEEICDVEEEFAFGAHSIRHHWTIDELRADPDAADGNPYHDGSRIAVHRCLAWLSTLMAEYPLTTDTEEEVQVMSGASAASNYAITLDAESIKAEMQDRFDNSGDPDLTQGDVDTVLAASDERISQLINNFADDDFWSEYDDVRSRVISQLLVEAP